MRATPVGRAVRVRMAQTVGGAVMATRKPKRYVYVLMGEVHYETSTVLGVYSTKRRAEKAKDAHVTGWYDDYSVERFEVDA